MLQARCPACQVPLTVPVEMYGKRVRCPKCKSEFQLAAPVSEPPPPVASQPSPQEKAPRKPSAQRVPRANDNSLVLTLKIAAAVVMTLTVVGNALWFGFFRPQKAPVPENVEHVANEPRGWAKGKMDPPKVDLPNVEPPKVEPKKIPQDIPPPKQNFTVRELPATFDHVAVGGGGRFLLLHLPQQRLIAQFDVHAAKVVHYFPTPDNNVRYAAGLESLVMLLPGTKTLERWNLLTKEKELSVALNEADKELTYGVHMGSASHGPFMLSGNRVLGVGWKLYDLKSLKPLRPRQTSGIIDTVRVSADGTLFASWLAGSSPSTVRTARIEGPTIKTDSKQTQLHVSNFHPGPDGRFLFTSSGIYSNDVRPIGPTGYFGSYCVPAVQGELYLSLQSAEIHVHLPGQQKMLARLAGGRPTTVPHLQPDPIGRDRRHILIPDANLVIVIPDSDRVLELHPFDVDAALAKAESDFIIVTSRPPVRAIPGETLTYQIQTKAKMGPVKYRLSSGPRGAELDAKGLLTWKVPNDLTGEQHLIVTLRDANGLEVSHDIRVILGDLPFEDDAKKR